MAEKDKKRRVRNIVLAILSGGTVLGVGAAVTLAAWQDDEFANGTFTATQFNMQGSVDGSAYSDNTTAPGQALSFTLPTATSIEPDDVVYAPFAVRLDTGTTVPATVTISDATALTGTDSLAGLSYELYSTGATFGCDAATAPTGTPLIASTALGTVPAATTGAPGTAENLCFVVTADDGTALVPGQTGTAVWDFTATP